MSDYMILLCFSNSLFFIRNYLSTLASACSMRDLLIPQCRIHSSLFSPRTIPRTQGSQSTFLLPLGLVALRRTCESIWRICPDLLCNNKNQFRSRMTNLTVPVRHRTLTLLVPMGQALTLQVLMKARAMTDVGRGEGESLRYGGNNGTLTPLCIFFVWWVLTCFFYSSGCTITTVLLSFFSGIFCINIVCN